MTDLSIALLRLVTRGSIRADDGWQGVAECATRLGADPAILAEAVAELVAAGLVHDPVRLPPGALQCHWHLEPTAAGRAAALAGPKAAESG